MAGGVVLQVIYILMYMALGKMTGAIRCGTPGGRRGLWGGSLHVWSAGWADEGEGRGLGARLCVCVCCGKCACSWEPAPPGEKERKERVSAGTGSVVGLLLLALGGISVCTLSK